MWAVDALRDRTGVSGSLAPSTHGLDYAGSPLADPPTGLPTSFGAKQEDAGKVAAHRRLAILYPAPFSADGMRDNAYER